MWEKRGYVHLHRKILENKIWKRISVFSRVEAWLDLIMGASDKDEIVRIMGEDYQNYLGFVLTSERSLADRWNWKRSKVRRFLSFLKKETMITIEFIRADKISRITIINYSKLNSNIITTDPVTATETVT